MNGRRKGRLTRRDRIIATNNAFDHWGAMFGKPDVAEKLKTAVPTLRQRGARHPSGKPLERDVLKAIIQRLRLDPRVAKVERNQSGVFQEGNRFIRVGTRGKLDLTVYLKSGRYAEIEVKRPGGKPEPHQQQRIDEIRGQGGIAGCATSPEEAIEILP